MIEACDSDADIETLRKMIKMQAGEDIKLTRKQMCEAYDNIHASKLPLPPLVMTSDRTYLLDRASPLKHMDYELLFDSSTKRVDLKRIARKVGLTSQIEQMTKKQLVDAIGKRLMYLKIHEPVKIVTKRLVVKKEERNVNNTAVNNTAVNSNANRYNNTAVNTNVNRYNNTAVNTNANANRYNNTAVNKNSGTVNVSGNKPGVKLQTNIFGGPPTVVFPKRLSFKPSIVASKTNSGTQASSNQVFIPTKNKKNPAFLTVSTSTSTGTNAGPPPQQPSLGGVFKKKPGFLNTSQQANLGGVFKKKPGFLNKKEETTQNAPAVAGPNAPKKPGMFNWLSKKKNANAGVAAGAAAGAAAAAGVASKKCGMMNRMMGRCKKNGTIANKAGPNAATNNANKLVPNTGIGHNTLPPNKVNAGTNAPIMDNTGIGGNTVSDRPWVKVDGVWTRDPLPGETGGPGTIPPWRGGDGRLGGGTGNNNQAATANTEVGTNNQPSIFNTLTGANKPKNTNNDVNYVANKIMNEVNKDVRHQLRNKGDDAILKSVSDDILDQLLKKDIKNSVNQRVNTVNRVNVANRVNTVNRVNTANQVNTTKVRTDVANDIMNQLLKKDITPTINKRVSHPKVNIADDIMNEVMKDVKSEIKNVSNNKNDINFVENKILNRITKDLKTTINVRVRKTAGMGGAQPKNVSNNKKDIDFVANKILSQLTDELKTNIKTTAPRTIRKGGRAAEPNQNNVFENASNNAFKINNNVKMVNNPLFNNNNGEISASSLTKNNIRKSVNNIPEEVEKQENVVRNMVTNLNSERSRIKNKVTKELNLRPDNAGVFTERRGLDKGRIGQWAKELREADTIEKLKNIESKLNQKTELRKNIENKYTKMGLTKVEKMDHRRKVVQFANNANARRALIEIQVKNKVSNNNNNTNSVISNYNSNANESNKKMKYASRENFINAKKVELRNLAKRTSTNFTRNINRLETRTNVAKLRGRIEGAILKNEPKNSRKRSERRVDNRALLKKLKKDVKKKNPGLSPAKVNAEARRLFRSLSKK